MNGYIVEKLEEEDNTLFIKGEILKDFSEKIIISTLVLCLDEGHFCAKDDRKKIWNCTKMFLGGENMEWLHMIRKSIQYMEEHLQGQFNIADMASQVGISSFYLQKGFKIMTGYTPTEYVKYRRLYLAAAELISKDVKVIDLAYRYGYETPESFTKAFTRFHGTSPMQIRKQKDRIKVFLPLKVKIQIQGGNDMDYVVEKMSGFKVIGIKKSFEYETSYAEIPKFWSEAFCPVVEEINRKGKPETSFEKAVIDNCLGEFAICVENSDKMNEFDYIIGGPYKGGEIPEGMVVFEFPEMEWVKFKCVGPMPGALQSVNTQVFQEWLPNNEEFEIAMEANIEWYSDGDGSAIDYESGIWVPVKRK